MAVTRITPPVCRRTVENSTRCLQDPANKTFSASRSSVAELPKQTAPTSDASPRPLLVTPCPPLAPSPSQKPFARTTQLPAIPPTRAAKRQNSPVPLSSATAAHVSQRLHTNGNRPGMPRDAWPIKANPYATTFLGDKAAFCSSSVSRAQRFSETHTTPWSLARIDGHRPPTHPQELPQPWPNPPPRSATLALPIASRPPHSGGA